MIPFFYPDVLGRVAEETRVRVERMLAERFPHLEVHVRSAQLMGDGIEVRGLSIVEPGALGPQAELAFFDEVFFGCLTSFNEMISGKPQITSVKLIRPVLRNTRRPDGSFSLSKLLPLPKADGPPAPLTIENGTVVIFDPLKNPSSTFTLRDISLTVRPRIDEQTQQMLLDLQGSLVADQIQHVELSGTSDLNGERWTIKGTVDGMEISPELRDSLPEPISDSLDRLASLRARATLSFQVTGDDPQRTPKFEVNGSVARGRIDDPLLPFPLIDLKANIHCDNSGFQIRDLTTQNGQTVWEVAQLDWGYDAASPMVLRGSGKRVQLNDELGNALPDPWRIDWFNYLPRGEVDLECELTYDGQRWKPMLKATCLGNVSFSCHKFPYRLERGRGTMTLQNNGLDVSLVAYTGAQPIKLDGHFLNPGRDFTGAIVISGEKIQFDDKLLGALDPKPREMLASLNPSRGTFSFSTRLWRDDPRYRKMRQLGRIRLNGCSINYEKFRYELNDLQGELELSDGQWRTVTPLKAASATGLVTLSGTLNTSPQEDMLSVAIQGKNVPLDEKLRNALSVSQRQLWNSLRPRGEVDVDALVSHNSRTKITSVGLRADLRDNVTSAGTSIEPVYFPFEMRKLSGSIEYHNGHVELKNLHATHRNTAMSTGGSCDFLPDGSWHLRLEKVAVERLRLHPEEHELMTAFPDSLKRALAELRPTGPINLKGNLDFSKRSADAPLESKWDLNLYLDRASLQAGPKLDNISGKVRLTGGSDGLKFSSRGELDIDTLMYKNFQFTDIKGPLYFDNANVLLGDWQMNQRTRRVTAKLFGGTITGECQIKLGAVPYYHLSASISGAELGQFARENLSTHQKLNGKLLGDIDLHGTRGSRTLFGSGNLRLSDADVYELPVMVSLLKIIRAKRPDSTAFTQSDIRFKIRGEDITFDQIDFRGDAVNLRGSGMMTLDGQTNPIKLEFHTMVGRGNIPLLSGMVSAASQQIMKIHVDGTLDHPSTSTELLPAANQALQQLQADYDNPASAAPTGGLMRVLSPRR